MNRIKQLREELKISQKELANKLNKTQQMVSLYENGTYELDLDGYLILSKLFNCSIEYIAGKSDVRNPEELKYAYHRPEEAEGLSDEEVNDALRFYKEMKKKIEGEKK